MRERSYRPVTLILVLVMFILGWAVKAEALEPTLKWKKEFKYEITSVDLAIETGDVILALNGREIILFDKQGNKRFHWGPRVDRNVGNVGISKDGRYFVFASGFTEEYAFRKNLQWEADNRIHYFSGQTKKELWNIKYGTPYIFPDGLSLISEYGRFSIFNAEGRKIFTNDQPLDIPSFKISPDSHYFALVRGSMQPLTLSRRDGTKLWERGRHDSVASISEGASYISTWPYSLGLSYTADPENTHKGTVYDRNGNKVLEGFGILSGDGSKVAMLSPDKASVLNLPNKNTIKEIPISINDIFGTEGITFAVFSFNGRYLVLRDGLSLQVVDLVEDTKRAISLPGAGRFPVFFYLTSDGRNLLMRDWQTTKSIYYYQLY